MSGFTLIEMAMVVVVFGILMSFALPSFQAMLRNSEIKTAAESIVSGIQRARAEAVTRNGSVSFTLGTASGWTVTNVADATTIDSRAASEGSTSVTLTAVAADNSTAATSITFNNLGQAVPNAANLATINLTAPGGTRAMRVTVGAGGNAKLCDPSLASGSSPRAC